MIIFTTPMLFAALIAMCAIHIAVSFLPSLIAKILNYVNLGLHIATLVLLMYYRADVDEALLLYMVSIFVYSVNAAVRYKIGSKRKNKEEESV